MCFLVKFRKFLRTPFLENTSGGCFWKGSVKELQSRTKYLEQNRNPVKLDRTRKVWYLLLRVFWLLLSKFNFWKGDWALDYVSTQIWDFSNICLFPKILSLNSFGNSCGNSYTTLVILGIKFLFTCGESDLY